MLILNLVVLYQQREHIEMAREQIKKTVDESLAVKTDLENLMATALQLSDQIVTDIQTQAQVSRNILSSDDRIYSDQRPTEAFIDYCNNRISSTDSEVSLISKLNIEPTIEHIDADQNEEIYMANQLKQANLHYEVARLYEQGLSISEIARRTNRGQGEISLILNLKNKRKVM